MDKQNEEKEHKVNHVRAVWCNQLLISEQQCILLKKKVDKSKNAENSRKCQVTSSNQRLTIVPTFFDSHKKQQQTNQKVSGNQSFFAEIKIKY